MADMIHETFGTCLGSQHHLQRAARYLSDIPRFETWGGSIQAGSTMLVSNLASRASHRPTTRSNRGVDLRVRQQAAPMTSGETEPSDDPLNTGAKPLGRRNGIAVTSEFRGKFRRRLGTTTKGTADAVVLPAADGTIIVWIIPLLTVDLPWSPWHRVGSW